MADTDDAPAGGEPAEDGGAFIEDDQLLDASDDPGGDGGDGEEGEGSDDDLTPAEAAALWEEQEAERAGQKATRTGGPKTGKDGGKPSSPNDPLQRFIDTNYGGDRDKFVDSLYESRARTKFLEERLGHLENGGRTPTRTEAQTRDADAEFKAARAKDSKIVGFDRDIIEREAVDKELQKEAQVAYNRALKLQEEIAVLDAKIASTTDPEDRYKLVSERYDKKADWQGHKNDYTNALTRRGAVGDAIRLLTDRRDEREDQLRKSLDNEYREKKDKDRNDQAVQQTFLRAYDEHTTGFDLDHKSRRGRLFYRTVRDTVSEYVGSLGVDAAGLDPLSLNREVGKVVRMVAKEFNIKAKSKGKPQGGPAPAPRPMMRRQGGSPQASPRAATVSEDDDSGTDGQTSNRRTPDQIRRRANAVLGASARQMHRRLGGRLG